MTSDDADLLDLTELTLADLKQFESSALQHALLRFLLDRDEPIVAAFESFIDRWP